MSIVRATVGALWPLHRLAWATRKFRVGAKFRQVLMRLSPVLDYHDQYGELGPELLYAWAVLDTHDALTDYYKHKRSAEEIAVTMRRLGLVNVETWYGGNGVEARARAPQ